MRYLPLFLLLATPAFAQQPPDLQTQLDHAQAVVTRTVSDLRSAVETKAYQIDALQRQLAAVTKERDDLRAASAAPKKE